MASNAPFLMPQLKLLIVDDSNVIRRRIERSQQIEQLQVVGVASNGVEAIEIFRQTDPDVVLILIVSALADKATAVEAMAKGANGFLNKPFSDRQLNEALAELIGGA